jgi:hypothetical protein
MCKHFQNGQCNIINSLSLKSVDIDSRFCKVCTDDVVESQGINKVTVSIALHHSEPKQRSEILEKHNYLLVQEPYGPGTELARLVSWFKFSNKKCKCAARIQKMNMWGPDECEKRKPTIIRWLRHSAYLNNVPFNTKIVDVLINKAIRNARKK